MKNRIFKLFIIIFQIFFFFLVLNFNLKCIFKEYLNIECPGCGLTRAFIEIINLNFYDAFNYNILSIPLFILLIIINISLIFDIIFDKNITDKIYNFLVKYWYVIIILLSISMIINNI